MSAWKHGGTACPYNCGLKTRHEISKLKARVTQSRQEMDTSPKLCKNIAKFTECYFKVESDAMLLHILKLFGPSKTSKALVEAEKCYPRWGLQTSP